MVRQSITTEIMEFMVWVVELVAHDLFEGDKCYAFNVLNEQGIWDLYVENYEITHSLSAKSIIMEIKDILAFKEVI